MPSRVSPTDYLVPEPWKIEGEHGLTFRIVQDEKGYYSHSEVRKLPEVVEYDGRLYRRTGWNSDTGAVYYKEVAKVLLARPAMREGSELGVLATCVACGDAARHSFCQEVRQGLHVRGLWAPMRESDLITAIFKAIEDAKSDGK